MTILVTGFSSFPGAPANPTEDLARALQGAVLPDGRILQTLVLPVEWRRGWSVLAAAIEATRPSAVLLLGLAARARRIRIELAGCNRRDVGLADAAGCYPDGEDVLDGPDALPVRLPLAAVAAALRHEAIDFEWSGDAGPYLCNDTLYRLAFHADRYGVARFGFVHMPLSDELVPGWMAAGALPERCRTLPAETLRRAAMAIVGTL